MSIAYLTNQTCDLYPATTGADGMPSYSGSATYEDIPCRVDASKAQRQTAEGITVMSDAVIFFLSSATLAKNTKIIVGSVEYIVDEIQVDRDLAGNVHHYECLCRMVSE